MARARLLDLTRSLRRAGRQATGIDRVERAYLDHFLSENLACFGLIRTPLGYLLLDRDGMAAFRDRLQGKSAWGKAGWLSRLGKSRDASVQRAESDARRLAVARARRGRLPALLANALTGGFDYFNTGHSNLTARVFDAVKTTGGHAHVLIHDVIPLTHPQFQRPGTIESFRVKMKQVSARADRIIFNSQDTCRTAEPILAEMGRVPPSIVAHLGTIPPPKQSDQGPADLDLPGPYFVTVGTIEPRKNHAFLLDLWDDMGDDAPHLLICGQRGWHNDQVFARLDALPPNSRIHERADLSDATLAHLIQNSAGLLFPSHVEGFGLPPLEAAQLGARVLCNDLPVLREFLQEKAVYASVSDRYLWLNTVKAWADNPSEEQQSDAIFGPTWTDHFKIVLRLKA